MKNTITYNIITVMGNLSEVLPFLSHIENKEFNSIGESNTLLNGTEITWEQYLNSLGKGKFKITQTEFNSGVLEKFTIVRKGIKPKYTIAIEELEKQITEYERKLNDKHSSKKDKEYINSAIIGINRAINVLQELDNN